MMDANSSGDFTDRCRAAWQDRIAVEGERGATRLETPPAELQAVCAWLAGECGGVFASLVVEDSAHAWTMTYIFYLEAMEHRIVLTVRVPATDARVPSIAAAVPAADWHEREAADLYGLAFDGRPHHTPFALRDGWPHDAHPMRSDFTLDGPFAPCQAPQRRHPQYFAAPGDFAMPIGPVFSDTAEAVHFRIDSPGEDVDRVAIDLFYKFRAVEKRAEGLAIDNALLLAERFSGTAAFAHGLAFCQAVETICGTTPPPRALALRCLLAELERMRSHAATIAGICHSTALAVAAAQAAIIEEDLLRLTCVAGGHRYLFGCVVPGGLAFDPPDAMCREVATAATAIAKRLGRLDRMLRQSSSFLDRLEEVGTIPRQTAMRLGLVGPVARASGVARDMRRLFAYAGYEDCTLAVPVETEGDGYARLRVWFREASESAVLIARIVEGLPDGPIRAGPFAPVAGMAFSAVEAPTGGAFHWLRLDGGGIVRRLHIAPPSFANWPGFKAAAEGFAFQDFPIILATFGLSAAENDR